MFYYFVAFFAGIFFRSMINHLFTNIVFINKMRELEARFLLLSVSFLSLREYSLALLEIIYNKAEEDGVREKEEYFKARKSIEEKFEKVLDSCIKNMYMYMPYKLSYTNWEEAKKHVKKIKPS